ncbi:MAG: hypothetical protein QOG54_1744 [Actinomycetota bacterium]|nr:hypothetical protein [Actinomycetota bacterium]
MEAKLIRKIPVLLLVATLAYSLAMVPVQASSPMRAKWTQNHYDASVGSSTRHSSDWTAFDSQRDSLDKALARGRLSESQYNLQRALSFVRPKAVAKRFGPVRTPAVGEATLVLRDLAATFRSLPRSQRSLAQSFFTRPDDGKTEPESAFPKYGSTPSKVFCSLVVCIHWVESGSHAPATTDSDGDLVPDYVEEMSADIEFAWSTETTDFGFATPSGDTGATNGGPDSKLDLYVADIEDTFGPAYVPSERTGSVYMVADNNYSLSIIPSGASADGPDFIADVLSHELFHVIQNEYDFYDDRWLIEGSAAWMEDEVYDDLNYFNIRLDSVYGRSALSDSRYPVDYGAEGFEYGAALFWRFLGELYGPSAGVQDRTLLRRILELSADPDPNSLEAVKSAIGERGFKFADDFTLFTVVNYIPEAFYEEGADYLALVGRPTVSGKATMTKRTSAVGGTFQLDHLSANYITHKPGTGVSSSAKLKVTVDGPPSASSPAATLLVLKQDNTFQVVSIKLDRSGDGSKSVAFGRGTVSSVVLVITNASTRFQCFRQSPFSCQGLSRDDGKVFKVTSKLVQ